MNSAESHAVLELLPPSEEHRDAVLDYKAEHLACGETVLHGGALLDRIESYDSWLELVRGNRRRETVHPGWVPSDTLLAFRPSDRRLVGIIDIRRELNDFLRDCGGHIGYGVRPSERRKGYAAEMLRLALRRCRELELAEVLLACHQDNPASRRTIEKCGGVPERQFIHTDGKPSAMFRIVLRPETDALLELAEANQAKARGLVERSGLIPAWEAGGIEVRPVGSLPMGLLMKHRDIDFHLYSPAPALADGLRAIEKIGRRVRVTAIASRDLLDTSEACIEWHLTVLDEDGDAWQLDLIHIRRGSAWDGYFEELARQVRAALTPELKHTILELKYLTPEEDHIIGIEYYHAVLGGGVRNWAEFVAWRRAHPVTGIVEWRPPAAEK